MTAREAASTSRRPSPGPADLGRRAGRLLIGALVGALLSIALTGCFSAPPQIVALEPNRGSTGVAADAPVRVTFDQPVVRSSVAGRFSVTPAIPGCDLTVAFAAPPAAACWIVWLSPESGFELLHPGAVFAPLTQYSFTLSGGFEAPGGARNGLDHHWDITSAPAPRVAATAPADRAVDVPVDAPLAVSFSAGMDAPTTAAAITLAPAVPGTRVVANPVDHSRFTILPGRLLLPGVTYAISVSRAARGDDEQVLAAPLTTHFTAAARIGVGHAAVLAGNVGANATELLLPALAPASPGDPIAAPVLATAAVCTAVDGCGVVAAGAPLSTYEAAAVAPDAEHVALVVDDLVSATAQLEVIDTVDGTIVGRIDGGVRPSWSPDGARLALVVGGDVDVLDVATGTIDVAEHDVGLAGPPRWADATTLVLSGGATGPSGVEIVNLSLAARYALPGVAPSASVVAVSPAGSRLAVSTPAGQVRVVPAAGSAAGGTTLPGRLEAIGFTDEGTLVAVTADTDQLVRISVFGGDSTALTLSAGFADLSTVRVAPDGRRLAYLATDAAGAQQAYVANADGSGALACTRFLAGPNLQALSVDFAL